MVVGASTTELRGVVKNPIVDHPHGGGEGRSPIGIPRPVNPWEENTALGTKTRKATEIKRIITSFASLN